MTIASRFIKQTSDVLVRFPRRYHFATLRRAQAKFPGEELSNRQIRRFLKGRRYYCFCPGGITSIARSGKDLVSSAGAAPLSSDPTQSPAHSFVPLTVPTSLQPVGSFGFTRARG